MTKKHLCPLVLLTALLPLHACTMPPSHASWQVATLPNSHQTIIYSAFSQKSYLIQVATIGKKPIDGYPVVYVLDGNAFFAISSSVAQLLHNKPNQPSPKSMMVVGIGYPTDKPFDITNRTWDYTPPSDSYPAPKGKQTKFGGADKFHAFMVHELAPLLDVKFGINPNHRTLLGHSYGGLFTLYALYRHSGDFDRYVMASPSIWWNNKSIHAHQPYFSPTPNIKHILITLGEHELNAKHKNPNTPTTDLQSSDAYLLSKMLATHLSEQVSFKFHAGHGHGENAHPSIVQGITLAYEACQTDKDCS